MKICIHSSAGQDMTIPVPNAMLFNPTLLGLWCKFGVSRSGHGMPEIPAESVQAICCALKNYAKIHGSWELVRVESANGDTVVITI